MNSIYAECIARGIPVANHYSDLYIPVTPQTTALIREFQEVGKLLSSPDTFVNQVEGGLWYDLPFQYEPYWEQKARKAEGQHGH